jgi:hypothetical protein
VTIFAEKNRRGELTGVWLVEVRRMTKGVSKTIQEEQMAMDFGRRFDELQKQAEMILAATTTTPQGGIGLRGTYVDQNQLINWQVKARNLISMVCGQDSQHFHAFEKNEKPLFIGDSNHSVLDNKPSYLPRKRIMREAT